MSAALSVRGQLLAALKAFEENKEFTLIKIFELLPPRRDIPLQFFHDHWRHPHGTLALHMGSVRRYIQHHRIASDVIEADANPFEGIAAIASTPKTIIPQTIKLRLFSCALCI